MQYKLTRNIFLLIFFFSSENVFSQIGIGTKTPDNKSIVEIRSTTNGLLLPRLTLSQLSTLASLLTPIQKGMLVTDNTTGVPLFWTGKTWNNVANLSAKLPLIVSSTNQVSLNNGTSAGDLITWDGNNWINSQPAVQHFTYVVNNMQPYIALNYCIALQGVFPSRSGVDPFVSEIQVFGFDFAPKGWAQCNGQLLPISQNTALFSLLGTYYGGDGKSTFALPDLQGRVAVKFGQGPGLNERYIGEKDGVESETITK
jgi:microcystin-dependent protein